MKAFLMARLKEPTTYLGLAMLAGVLGVPPDTIAAGSKIAAIIGSMLGVAIPETK
jgi:hypothetical protein